MSRATQYCDNCRFHSHDDYDLCQRRAPIIAPVKNEWDAPHRGIWPEVSPRDWCGDWEKDDRA